MADALNEVNPLYTGAIDVIEGADAYDRDDYVGMGRATAGLGVTIVMTIITWKGGKTTRGPPKGNGNKRPGNRGHPDHQADVKGGGKRQAEALARPGERVVMEGRIEGHPGINRRADNQVIGTDNRTRVVVESERRPGGTYHKKRVKELEAAGIEVHTRPPSQWGK